MAQGSSIRPPVIDGDPQVGWSSAIHQGLRKPNQQDSLDHWVPGDGDHPGRPRAGYLFVLADGVGGEARGDEASRAAADVIITQYASQIESTDDIPQLLHEVIETANHYVYRRSIGNGMATTCVCLAIRESRMTVAWIGDSRAYCLRQGRLLRLTQDHSWAAEVGERLLAADEITPEEFAANRHKITRALGLDESVEPSIIGPDPLYEGDRLLLCSDGLWDLVSEDLIKEWVGQTSLDIVEIAGRLVELANVHGGRDNISLFLIDVNTLLRTEQHLAAGGSVPVRALPPRQRLVLIWDDSDLEPTDTIAPSPAPVPAPLTADALAAAAALLTDDLPVNGSISATLQVPNRGLPLANGADGGAGVGTPDELDLTPTEPDKVDPVPPTAPPPPLRWPLIALTVGGVLVLLILFVSQSGILGRPTATVVTENRSTPTLVAQGNSNLPSPTLVAIQIPATGTTATSPAATAPTFTATPLSLPATATARPVPPTDTPQPAPPTTTAKTAPPTVPAATAQVAAFPTATPYAVANATAPPAATEAASPDNQELRLIKPLFDPQPDDHAALPPPWQDRSLETICKGYGIHYAQSGSGGYWLYGDFYRFWECNTGSEENYFDGSAFRLMQKISQPGEHLLGAPLSQVINYTAFMQAIHLDNLDVGLSTYLVHAAQRDGWDKSKAGVQFFENGVIVCSEVLPKYPRPAAQGDCDLLNAGTLFTTLLPPNECPGGCWQGPPGNFDTQFSKPLGIRIGPDSQAVYYERLALQARPDGSPTIAPLGRWLRDLILKSLDHNPVAMTR